LRVCSRCATAPMMEHGPIVTAVRGTRNCIFSCSGRERSINTLYPYPYIYVYTCARSHCCVRVFILLLLLWLLLYVLGHNRPYIQWTGV
jgi:hypothetical protein